MTEIELIDVGILDVKSGSPFSLNFQAQDVLEPEKKTSSFSKNISLIGTKNNNQVLGFQFDINISDSSFNVNKKVKCNVIQNGVNVFENAFFQLLSVDTSPNGEIVYTGRVTSNVTNFFTEIKNKELTDLELPVFGLALNKATISDTYDNDEDDVFKFIAHANEMDNHIFSISDFKPAVFVKTYFDAIHSIAGFSYEFDEWDDLNINKLLIPTTNKIEANEDLEEANNVFYLNSSSNTYDLGIANSSSTFDSENIDFGSALIDSNNQFNNTTSVYTPSISSKLVFSVEANIMFTLDVPNGNGVKVMGGVLDYKLEIINAQGNVSNSVSIYSFSEGEVVPVGNHIPYTSTAVFQIPITAMDGVPFTDIKFRLVISGGGKFMDQMLNTPTDIQSGVDVNQIAFKTINDLSYNYGLPVNLNDFIPKKVKQSDFIKSICQMFNLVIVQDKDNASKIIYKKRDTWYDEGKEEDWTDLLDYSKEIKKEWIQYKQPKVINLKYKEDKDPFNAAYQDNFKNTYGAYDFTFENEFNVGEKDEEVVFSPTPFGYNASANMYLPYILAGENNIRILIDNGRKTDGYYFIRNEDGGAGSVLNDYVQALHFDDPNFPSYDINFGLAAMYFSNITKYTQNNLFRLHHLRRFSQLSTGRIVTEYFKIDEIRIKNIELNDRIFIKDTWYNINKISNYNANGNQTTKVELITVDDSQVLDFNKIVGTSSPSPVPFNPSNPVIIGGTTGYVSGVYSKSNNNLSGGTVIGRNNNVASDFRGVAIGNGMVVSGVGFVHDGINLMDELTKLENRIYKSEDRIYKLENPPNFDITGNWNLALDSGGSVSPVVDEATFRQYLTDGYHGVNDLTSINISSFSLINRRLLCCLYANGNALGLLGLDIIDVNGVGDINGLTDLSLEGNQIVNFDPTIALPSSLTYLSLESNQMTAQGYIDSEPWAKAQPVFTNPCDVHFGKNTDSIKGTKLESILISKNCSITG